MKVRDSQRSRVYKCDPILNSFGRLETVEEIELFVKKVWYSKRLRKAFPKAVYTVPQVRDGRGRRNAGGCIQAIHMPVWSRFRGIILHELAHTVTKRVYGGKVAEHGWEFCDIYLTLVRIGIGREAHDTLKAEFKKHRVRFRKPRTRPALDPEARKALVARLAEARSKKAA